MGVLAATVLPYVRTEKQSKRTFSEFDVQDMSFTLRARRCFLPCRRLLAMVRGRRVELLDEVFGECENRFVVAMELGLNLVLLLGDIVRDEIN